MADDELQTAVRTFCQYVTVLTGCHIEPAATIVTLKTIKNFLATQYSFLTAKEIQTAFEMNCSGQHWPSVSHYNRPLNCDYIGQVLAAYNDHYRSEHVLHIGKVLAKTTLELSQPSDEKPVTDDDRREMLQMAYTGYCNAPKMPILGVKTIYGYAERFGLLKKDAWRDDERIAMGKLRALLAEQIETAKRNKLVGAQVEFQKTLDDLKRDKLTDYAAQLLMDCSMELALKSAFKLQQQQKNQTLIFAETR